MRPFVGGDAHAAKQVPLGCIAPYATAAPWHQAKGAFRAPARGTFALGGKSTQKRRSNLRFENPFARLHPPRILTAFATRTLCRGNFTEMLHCLCFSFRCRFCSEMQSCAVLYLVCRGGVLRCGAKRNECPWGTPPAVSPSRSPTYIYQRQKHFPNQRPKAATYLCRFAAKARFDNRPNPRRVFPKREGRSPPSLVAQGWGIFKGEGRSKLPSPLNGAFGYFCRY